MQKIAKLSNVTGGSRLQLFDNPKQLVTVKQAAAALGVSIYRVYRWIYDGELKAHRLPGERGSLKLIASDVEGLLRPAYPEAGRVPEF